MNEAIAEAHDGLDAAEDFIEEAYALLDDAMKRIQETRGELDRIAEYQIERDHEHVT